MLVEIIMTSLEVVEQFKAAVASFDEVTEVRRVYGAVDYLFRVDVHDENAYHRIVSHPTMKLIKSSD